ncbi:acyl-CoA thioester hydrolase [Halospina denitrificans]|uniref:Acyl-CoA thioester hydrolase n=1 Tax=Halospina denitrificans TaxID=332522 RepID=A0A4R7K0L2_9GAMM|nr:tol-pal system-associated acyl-CoA thioesterase [Halospina denitrificans]TDT42969.1 acyl-CoA thioester hydrolase [Halospina denitrificans]
MTDFRWPVRIYVEDTDAGGIVFYANYLKYFERARTEWVRSRGVALRGRLEEGIAFVVHSLNIRYLQPAFLDDELEISADLISATRTAMTFRQEAWRRDDGAALVSGEVKVACVQLPSGRPRRIPEDLDRVLKDTLSGNE